MVTVASRGEYWLTNDSLLLMLRDEQEAERVYRFFLDDGQRKIRFISSNDFNFTKDVTTGRYRIYEVKSEQSFNDGVYLELCICAGKWDCYILTEGLPDKKIPEKGVIDTNKCITKTVVRN